ncbi:hypothetical protein [Roseomonas fluvialis]|uniref:Hedgehog/Intein (Hint) domain-containing protein n=1 Tax=Roseomonas fluvialis TaxID=1750527 RepID=A0ABM7Y7T9_9PROT|nr:hypothetical protein [Roseomonas fluvialis]BDG74015.1 hypothetical protein Rmf_39440 [Roseomonas fluvialis]
MSADAATFRQGGLHLQCLPNKVPDAFVFAYRAENQSAAPIYVMDAMPQVDRGTRAVSANPQAAAVILREDGIALVGKFIAPLPQDRILLAPDLPLCTLVQPGEAIERELLIPLPFAEASPFFPDLQLRDYAMAEVSAIAFAIGFFVAATPGLYGAPAAYAPGLHVISPTIAPFMAGLALRTLPVKKLEILKRSDAFPRELRAHAPG